MSNENNGWPKAFFIPLIASAAIYASLPKMVVSPHRFLRSSLDVRSSSVSSSLDDRDRSKGIETFEEDVSEDDVSFFESTDSEDTATSSLAKDSRAKDSRSGGSFWGEPSEASSPTPKILLIKAHEYRTTEKSSYVMEE